MKLSLEKFQIKFGFLLTYSYLCSDILKHNILNLLSMEKKNAKKIGKKLLSW